MTKFREISKEENARYEKLANHPLQSWNWGMFREKCGIPVFRIGRYKNNILSEVFQITIHKLPLINKSIAYCPKSPLPSKEMVIYLKKFFSEKQVIFIKFEPDIILKNRKELLRKIRSLNLVESKYELFPKYTFILDLTKTENELKMKMHPKTRYNIKVAQKHGVTCEIDNSTESFREYLTLMKETTVRQKYFAHNDKYHYILWNTLKKSDTSHLLRASKIIEGHKVTLTLWMLFLYKNKLYYPYGASSSKYRRFMASNLTMWEAIRFGIKNKAETFDMWGSLGPNPDPKDPWYGFHKFKVGYSPQMIEFAGSFDLIIDNNTYPFFLITNSIRKAYLKIRSFLPR